MTRQEDSTNSNQPERTKEVKKCCNCLTLQMKPNFLIKFLKRSKTSKYFTLTYYRNNLSSFITIALYFLINILLAIIQFFVYSDQNIAVRFARIGGILLDFNSSLIILLVLRRLTTWVRNSLIGRNFLPVDQFIKFHKFIGVFIIFYSILHTVAHCVNLYWLSEDFKNLKAIKTLTIHNGTIVSTIINSLAGKNLTDVTIHNLDSIEDLSEVNSTNASFIVSTPGATFVELLFTNKSGIGWIKALAMPTGWALWVVLLIIEIFSLPCIRKKGYFQVFYYTHWLHVVYYIILIIHATHYWKWFILPFVLVIFERLFTFIRYKSIKYGDTYIRDVNLLSSKVTQLIIPRPPNFKFKSGDYLFIKIPKIARYEWHPFTISSAPELKGELWLHVRSLGNWTNKLYEYFHEFSKFNTDENIYSSNKNKVFFSEAKYERRMSNYVVMIDYRKNSNDSPIVSSSVEDEENIIPVRSIKKYKKNLNISNQIKNVWMDITIDGPYSTPSRRIFDSEHVILIAGGIGVTPFASILQSIWFKFSKSLKTCPDCNHQWYDQMEKKNLKRVDFIWVNRDYQSFEWFIELLGQLELQQINSSKRFIGLHLYMTSASTVQEIKPLDNPDFDKNGQIESKMDDFVLKLNPGRPDFDKLFTELTKESKDKVDVFFCGNRDFGKFVQKKCFSHNFKFNKEYF
ncbi:unnamed protein product [Brachionus calyciflorus]|uniref:FAD-binding FR-type domain-containing protein n=1 Tax=Brachionus calyciflorus TaxID=104777 RepID=A0A813NZG1_9BILA|nr:unnamed protein product [Brachionus calyciflorus]